MFRYQPTRKKDALVADQILTSGRMKALGKIQDVHEVSTVQNYDIGTRLVMDDRVFRYCKAKEDLLPIKGGCGDVMPREGNVDAVDYEVGSFTINIPENPEGPDYLAEAVKDYWKEGYIWIQTVPNQLIRIKSSAAAVDGFITLTLWEALKVRVAGSGVGTDRWITAWVNPYSVLVPPAGGKLSIIVEPLVAVAAGSYFWGQTWGPMFGVLNGSAIGRTASDRMLYFTTDGSVQAGITQTESDGGAHKQVAGFLITNTSPWTNEGGNPELGGDQFYMLQLSP